MNCSLLIPDLFWPQALGQDPARDLALPALETLLARAAAEPLADAGAEAWLCRTFGLSPRPDWPIAPLTLEADGGRPGPHYWLRADPIHLRVDRDRLLLADSGAFPISRGEAEALTATLNAHFGAEAMIFYPLRPERWYLRLDAAPAIRTRPLPEVAGGSIDAHLPEGPDALHWARVFNEIQMLFHEHPVNQAREERGEAALNSVWLWGGGVRPQAVARPFASVSARDILPRALARASGAPCQDPPASAADWLEHAGAGEHLLVLDELRGAAQYADAQGFRQALEELERAWLAPLLAGLKRGRPAQLRIAAVAASGSRRFSVARRDLWKLWRRRKPLAALPPGHA